MSHLSDELLFPGHRRRRSADLGGLLLASEKQGSGHGYGSWEEDEVGEMGTCFAELLSDMYNQTSDALNDHSFEFSSPDISSDTRTRLIKSLDGWNFEPHKLPDEEVLWCTVILFEALFRMEGMQEDLGVSLEQISIFLHHLRQIYRWENSYHNYEHALDTLQASQMFLRSAGMIPPVSILLEGDDRMWKPDKPRNPNALISCLGNRDLFVLYIAAIGHDVGHPGFTNNFMKNARAPLAVVYDDRSPLEQMHCYLLLKIMRERGLGSLINGQDCPFRKLLWQTVLATDMSVHKDFMELFKALVSGEGEASIDMRRVLVCQAIIKCADISNPSRPHIISQHWASALTEEWSSQAELEKQLHLPSTVHPTNDPLSEAHSQIWFINAFAQPLLDLTVRGIPEMQEYAEHCAINLSTWKARCAELRDNEDSARGTLSPSTSYRQPDDYATVFPFTLPPAARNASHSKGASWQTHTSFPSESSSSSRTSSEYGSQEQVITRSVSDPASPSESLKSFATTPNSDAALSYNFLPSRCESVTSNHTGRTDHAHRKPNISSDNSADIRATFQAGVRKKKSFYRNSWNPGHIPSSPSPWPSTTPSETADDSQSTVAVVLPSLPCDGDDPNISRKHILMTHPKRLDTSVKC